MSVLSSKILNNIFNKHAVSKLQALMSRTADSHSTVQITASSLRDDIELSTDFSVNHQALIQTSIHANIKPWMKPLS